MKNLIEPIKDAADRVIDFVVKHECEGCKRRRKKVKAFYDREIRDRMRKPRVK